VKKWYCKYLSLRVFDVKVYGAAICGVACSVVWMSLVVVMVAYGIR
jgi:hypothetical protein